MRRLFAISFFLVGCRQLFAHTGVEIVTRPELWHAWTFEPAVLALLILSAALYAIGLARSGFAASTRWQRLAFWSGWLTLFISQISPLHKVGEALFSAHMVQHELLMLIAAPLLVYSRPLAPFLWALPPALRVRLGSSAKDPRWLRFWRTLNAPLTAWTLHAAALWGWHIPFLYQQTLIREPIHALQHASFLGTALLFWWALMHEQRARNYGASVAYIFTTAIHSGALGALLTFAPGLVYPIYEGRTAAWGLSPLEDQQLGGLIMWVPSGVVFIAIGLWLFARWLQESERRVAVSTTITCRPD